jgi:undecaprenyl-diphosphatase
MAQPTTLPALLGQLRVHLYVLLAFFTLLGLPLAVLGYFQSFLAFNSSLHHPLMDVVMPHWTHLGDGLVAFALLVLLLWPRDPALALLGILTAIGMGLAVQLLKNQVFADWYRPAQYFLQHPEAHILPPVFYRNSFPSGHSMTVLTSGLFLAYGLRDQRLGIRLGLSVFLCLTAYSRVYVGAHFPGDVLMSGVLGTAVGLLSLRVGYDPFKRWFAHRSFRQRNALRWAMLLLAGVALVVAVRLLYMEATAT